METSQKIGDKMVMKKKLPQVRQTLTSKLRMLRANPLLAYELEKKLPVSSKTKDKENMLNAPLKDLVTVLDSTLDVTQRHYFIPGGAQFNGITSNTQSLVGKINVKLEQEKGPKRRTSMQKNDVLLQRTSKNLKSLPTHKLKDTKNLKPPIAAPRSFKAVSHSGSIKVPLNTNIESTQPTAVTPSVERHTLMFRTPNNSVLQDITMTKSGNCANLRRTIISTPAIKRISTINIYDSKEISQRLKEWLTRRGKSLGDYHHLKCFGVHTPNTQKNKLVNVEKENRNVDSQIIEVTKPEVDLPATTQGALQDLHKLILDGYPAEHCEMWLNLIKQKCGFVVNEPDYWECRAALEQTKGNLHLAVECYKTAIVHGAETQNVDKCLDQLLQKFNLLNINSELSPSVNKERNTIVKDVRNIFKSSIIQFAVQEKNIKKKDNEGFIVEKRLIATPVRRSTRRSRSAFTSTPGVHIYSTLQDVDDAIRDNLSFQCNRALDS